MDKIGDLFKSASGLYLRVVSITDGGVLACDADQKHNINGACHVWFVPKERFKDWEIVEAEELYPTFLALKRPMLAD